MNMDSRYNTIISVESKTSARRLFDALHEIVGEPEGELHECATELFYRRAAEQEEPLVSVSMEFGEVDGESRLCESDEDEDDESGYQALEHSPYIEVQLSSLGSANVAPGVSLKDIHAFVLREVSTYLDDNDISWGFYTDADAKRRWFPGEQYARFGNASIGELELEPKA